jgi:hypothetical protein
MVGEKSHEMTKIILHVLVHQQYWTREIIIDPSYFMQMRLAKIVIRIPYIRITVLGYADAVNKSICIPFIYNIYYI